MVDIMQVATEQLMTSQEVAKKIGVTDSCLRNWRSLSTKGPSYIRLGDRFIRYRPSDVDAWLHEHTHKTVDVPQTVANA